MANETEPVAPERPSAAASVPEARPWPNGTGGTGPMRPGWFDQPERPAGTQATRPPRRIARPERPGGEAPKPPNAGSKRPGWFDEPDRGARPPEHMPGPPDGNDRLVATLNHGGWGPPPGPETTGPLDTTPVDGPPQAHGTDEPGDR